jgi:hypothetical protein
MSANVMTREQKLYAMRMVDLAEVAEKLGVKIDKKGKKSVAVQKILDAESKDKAEKLVELKEEYCGDGTSLAEVGKEIAEQAKQKANVAKKNNKKQKTVKSVSKSKREKSVEDFDKLLDEFSNLLKKTNFVISEAKTSGRYKYIVDNNVKGSTVLIYLGKKRITMLLRNNQILELIKPSRTRNTSYSKAYDIEYSKKDKLVEYLNKITYNNDKKSKKGEK